MLLLLPSMSIPAELLHPQWEGAAALQNSPSAVVSPGASLTALQRALEGLALSPSSLRVCGWFLGLSFSTAGNAQRGSFLGRADAW